jgi:LacI family transcriptional regulator
MGTTKLPRLKDVAREADVSLTAASIILRDGKGRFNKQTRERVLAAARKLGWRRNLLVSGMQTGRTRNIGVLIQPYDSYWKNILSGVQYVLADADYMPITLWVTNEQLREKRMKIDAAGYYALSLKLINRLIDRRVDGLILPPDIAVPYYEHFGELTDYSIPVVVIDYEFLTNVKADSIGTDEELGGRLLAEHLIGLGHRHFLCVTGAVDTKILWLPKRGNCFKDAVSKYSTADCKIVHMEISPSTMVNQFCAIIKNNPDVTAFYGITDHLAKGFYYAAKKLGLRIPEDISVVGFADLDFSEFLWPPLTTVRQDAREIGRRAAKTIISRLAGEMKNEETIIVNVGCELIVRGSTGPAKTNCKAAG